MFDPGDLNRPMGSTSSTDGARDRQERGAAQPNAALEGRVLARDKHPVSRVIAWELLPREERAERDWG